ncbi:hypothetical protein [Legionella sp. km772]|uniref:hypothetical protein n=1 Tax=Legionella sp. km772 TaxID=2498111 RepID=UPI000F8D220D|nr:hypothetical protein [Legionella sp. km772]RUR13366.1 hypothetical protein ELY15_02685 [Legionella sp. km772]
MDSFSRLSADIETTVLVAVWSKPIVFQGYYKITQPNPKNELFLYYRAVCEDYYQDDFLNEDFFPDQVEFTHLYNQQGIINKHNNAKEAVYLLKYPLFVTVTQMLKNQKQYLTYMDEIALNALIERTTALINNPVDTKLHEDLGFSVEMNFKAAEKESEAALKSLIQLAK